VPKVMIPPPSIELTDDSWYLFLYTLYQYSRCNYELALGGILNISSDQISNNGSSSTDLINYVFQKNQLKTNDDCLFYKAKGIYAANGNNKKIVLTFGSQTIFDTTDIAINGGAWIFEVEVTRTDSSSQNIFVKGFYNNLAKTAFTSGTQDLSTNIDIKLTATGFSSEDITLKEYCINLNPID